MMPSDDSDGSTSADPVVRDGDGSVTVDVVIAVSDALGTAPDDLEPLENVIDTEALETLVGRDGTVSVEFDYEQCTVTVSDGGTVRVEPPTRRLP